MYRGLDELPNEAANEVVVREVFGRLDTAAALPRVREHVRRWRPDVVVRETSELASFVAAREEGVPAIEVPVSLPFLDTRGCSARR